MRLLQTITGRLSGPGRGRTAFAGAPALTPAAAFAGTLTVALVIAFAVFAGTPDVAAAQDVSSGGADIGAGIDEGQSLTVGLIGLAAAVILAVLVIKQKWPAVIVCVAGAAVAIMFADDPTGTITSAVVSVVELLTGQGGG